MIVAGIHYARDEVDAARHLLRDLGQSERALRSVLEFVRRERVGGGAPPPTPVPAHRRVEHKRRALDRLTRRWAQLRRELDPTYTWPQAQARVNRAMGVRRRADAGEPELDAGLNFLRTELTKLSRELPRAGRTPPHHRQRRGHRPTPRARHRRNLISPSASRAPAAGSERGRS
jgi:hypothetical protein